MQYRAQHFFLAKSRQSGKAFKQVTLSSVCFRKSLFWHGKYLTGHLLAKWI